MIPLVVVEELDQHKTRMDDVGRAARAVIRSIEELRVANGGDIRTRGRPARRRHAAHRDERPPPQRDPRARASTRAKTDNRILAASLGQAVHGRTVVVSNDAALRIKAAQLGLEAMRAPAPAGPRRRRAAVGLEHDRGRARRSSTPSTPADGIGHRRARRCRRRRARGRRAAREPATRCSGPAASPRWCATPTARSMPLLRAPEPWGLRPAVEGAAVRPRPPARPRGARRRPRRHGRHRQDDPRPGRRARAGDGRPGLRQGRRVPARRARRARPSSGSCPARLDEKLQPVDDRGHRRARRPHRAAQPRRRPGDRSTR